MIARVAPLRRLPANLDYFDYQIPPHLESDIRPGSLVKVPFRRQRLTGVVLEIVSSSEWEKIQSIDSIASTELTRQQVELLRHLADLYHLSASTLLPLFVASEPKRKSPLSTTTPSISGESTPDTYHSWAIYDDWNSLSTYAQAAIKVAHGQTLIIIPEYYLLPLARTIAPEALIVPPKVEKLAYWHAWEQSHTAPVIIGTFHSLFLPFHNLQQLIIIDADNNQLHRSEQNPRLHLSDFISHYQRLYGCKLLLASLSPSCNLFQATRQTALPVKSIERKSNSLIMVDMTSERDSGGHGLLSQAAQDAVAHSAKTVLYLNHYGTANMVACARCKWVAECPRCNRALSYQPQSRDLRCWNCQLQHEAVMTCPRCYSTKLKLRSSGLSRLVREVQELWPDKKVSILSQRLTSTIQQADIVVATSKILSTDLKFDLAVAIHPDGELWRPDFNATEELRQHLRQLLVRSQSLIIQTATPNHYVYQSLTNFKAFISEELAFRQEFNYPPFIASYKIFIKDKVRTKSIQEELITRIESQTGTTIAVRDDTYLIIRGSLSNGFIDNLVKTYNNRILIEINPYQWN